MTHTRDYFVPDENKHKVLLSKDGDLEDAVWVDRDAILDMVMTRNVRVFTVTLPKALAEKRGLL